MQRPSLTSILSCLFLAYMSYSLYTIAQLFFPPSCPKNSHCLSPYIAKNSEFELHLFTSLLSKVSSNRNLKLISQQSNFSLHDETESTVNVSIPKKTRNNGTLYVHAFLVPRGEVLFQTPLIVHRVSEQTTWSIPQASTFKLVGDQDENKVQEPSRDRPISHWRSRLTINIVTDLISFEQYALPRDIYRFIKLTPRGEYLPLFHIDEISNRIRDLQPLNSSCTEMSLTIHYKPISIGRLRLWSQMAESMRVLQSFGFTEKDTDEVKALFADTNLYLLLLTFIISIFHLLFDFLAFKNDISYWQNRRSMVGLSSRTVVWRCLSTIIIFFYLLDEETSMLVLIPAGIGTVIELWKVSKAFKVSVHWSGLKPSFRFGSTSDKEKETQAFDSQAMQYLSYLLYPLCMAGAVYSLLYTPHKSWYSWCIRSLVNGVYAFGFLFMLPQLFVNYKLKSVAHLPWRAFMYKAFNTFIDDVFAFIIVMPTAHRLACFRDDIIFVVYLYQRWLYPVDKKRVNEYGQSFEEDTAKDTIEETKKTK